jgi:hypothetical protein
MLERQSATGRADPIGDLVRSAGRLPAMAVDREHELPIVAMTAEADIRSGCPGRISDGCQGHSVGRQLDCFLAPPVRNGPDLDRDRGELGKRLQGRAQSSLDQHRRKDPVGEGAEIVDRRLRPC